MSTTDLSVAERAAVLRALRIQRDLMRLDLSPLKLQASLGSEAANAASVVLDAEIMILDAAIRKLWSQQPGAGDPPAPFSAATPANVKVVRTPPEPHKKK